jgi:hypothetical protein
MTRKRPSNADLPVVGFVDKVACDRWSMVVIEAVRLAWPDVLIPGVDQ